MRAISMAEMLFFAYLTDCLLSRCGYSDAPLLFTIEGAVNGMTLICGSLPGTFHADAGQPLPCERSP